MRTEGQLVRVGEQQEKMEGLLVKHVMRIEVRTEECQLTWVQFLLVFQEASLLESVSLVHPHMLMMWRFVHLQQNGVIIVEVYMYYCYPIYLVMQLVKLVHQYWKRICQHLHLHLQTVTPLLTYPGHQNWYVRHCYCRYSRVMHLYLYLECLFPSFPIMRTNSGQYNNAH